MSPTKKWLCYTDNGIVNRIFTGIQMLKREGRNEFLYTEEGQRIPLDQIISINGRSWA